MNNVIRIASAAIMLFLLAQCGQDINDSPSPRGNIYDCDGNLVATSKIAYDVHLDCKQLDSYEEWSEKTLVLAPRLAALLPERGAAEWWEYLQNGRRLDKRYLIIARAITQEKKDSLAELPIFDMPQYQGGAIYEPLYVRHYPYGGLAKRVIGHALPRQNGLVGIEGKYDKYLKETDVRLTISMDMQSAADSAMRSAIEDDKDIEAGCIVIMDVHSGAVKAMVNLSRRGDSDHLWECYNDAIAHSYEPGEVLQTMTLASVLRDGYCQTYTVLDAFATDSHEALAQLATEHYDNAKTYYTEGLRNFCLPKGMNFDVEGLREVVITKPDGYFWQDYTLGQMANGCCMTITPLDILSFYNTIANKGQMVKPFLVVSIGVENDTSTPGGPATHILKECVLSRDVTDSLAFALSEVVERGSARLLKDANHSIAAKTGTARQVIRTNYENGQMQDPYIDNEGRYQSAATCVGFFPAWNPEYSIICALFSTPCNKTYYGNEFPLTIVRDIVNSISI